MTYEPKANKAFTCGVEAYLADDTAATFEYGVDVPFEFVMHGYRDGKFTVEESAEGDPVVYIKKCKSRAAMQVGDSMLNGGEVVCEITNDADVPVDVLFLMHERGLIRKN